jgi:hypothetical protein
MDEALRLHYGRHLIFHFVCLRRQPDNSPGSRQAHRRRFALIHNLDD